MCARAWERTLIDPGKTKQDKRLRLVGLYARTAVDDMFGAMAAKPFRALGMDPVESEVFLAAARKDLNNPEMHCYENFFFWTAQKPEAPAGPGKGKRE